MTSPISSLRKLLDVNIPIIYIDDYDYVRVDKIIEDACCGDISIDEIKEWNPATGYTRFDNKEPISSDISLPLFLRDNVYSAELEEKNIEYIVLRGVGKLIDEPSVISLLSHIAQRKLYDRSYDTSIIISDFDLTIPQQLLPYVSILSIDLPNDEEIENLIYEHLDVNNVPKEELSAKDRESLMPSLRGLSRFEIDRVLDMAMSVNGTLDIEDKEMILKQKKAQVKKSGLVELIDVKETTSDIGGLNNLKQYLINKSRIMQHLAEAHKNYLATPKGVFIVGMPGCGKSLCAKAAAAQFGCPLLKLDMGSMMGQYVGQSESNLRKAIKIAEAAAPCVLWIDEIEKGFSGVGGHNDIMTRMFGYFLSWMQDKTSSVYVIATANNADNLPPELKRKGRFDEIFCVNLPNAEERKAIFEVHLKKRKQNVKDLTKIVRKTDGFNGADIESVVNEALEKQFLKNLDDAKDGKTVESVKLTEDVLLDVAGTTVSISMSCRDQIKKMVEVFKDSNFTNASEVKSNKE